MAKRSFRYNTHTSQLDLAGTSVRITHITNVDDLLQALIEKGEEHEDYQDERLPYWADLWHSAIALARYVVENKVAQPGEQVTEIGCGLGLPGIVAGMLGAEVTLTDYLPEALEFARLNWEQNVSGEARYAQMDWRQPDPTLAADLLLASDVAYEERSFADLLKALPQLVRPGGRILLSEPTRAIARPFIEQLMNKPEYESHLSVWPVEWDGFTKKVQIIDLQLKQG